MKIYTHKLFAHRVAFYVFLTGAVATMVVGNLARADVSRDSQTRTETFSYDPAGRTVFLGNLAGEISISASRSNNVEITATVVAGGDDAKSNLDLVGFEEGTANNRLELRTLYPVDDYDTFIYERKNGGNSQTNFRYQGEKIKVGSGRRMRDGIELHVDYDIQLPAGVSFTITNGMGEITVDGVDGDIRLKNKSGPITSTNTSGEIVLDTGSGSLTGSRHTGDFEADSGSGRVRVTDVSGNVEADTGSGSIEIENIGGELKADTGSGGVKARNIGGEVRVDTGSGRVVLDEVNGSISVDTGSGSIDIDGWSGGSRLDLDTGSGSISVHGNFASVERMRVDTGSGSVALVSNTMPNMKLSVSSRGMEIDFLDMTDVKQSRSSFRGTLGAGAGRGEIDTGSGSVSFRLGDI